jgi:hypothetical protein
MKNIAGDERALEQETAKLRRSLDAFTRKSTALPPETFDSLDNAAGEMSTASGQLDEAQSNPALEHGKKALEHLQNGQKGLDAAQGMMKQTGEKSGKGMARPVQVRSGGGVSGIQVAPVQLPGANEYKPPRVFRQEIIEALKEKYPQKYEKIIKEYYRKLTE